MMMFVKEFFYVSQGRKSTFNLTQFQPSHGLLVNQVIEFRKSFGFFSQFIHREGTATKSRFDVGLFLLQFSNQSFQFLFCRGRIYKKRGVPFKFPMLYIYGYFLIAGIGSSCCFTTFCSLPTWQPHNNKHNNNFFIYNTSCRN